FLVQNRETIEPKGVPQKIDRRTGLFNNSKQRGRIGNGNRAAFRDPAKVLEQELQLLGQFFRGLQFFRHLTRSVTREDKTVVGFALQKHAFEDVLAQIDPKYRVSAPRHGGALHIAGSVPASAVFYLARTRS